MRETPAIPIVDDQALVGELLEIFAAQAPTTTPDRLAEPGGERATTLMLAELGPVERRVAIAVMGRPGTLDDLVEDTGLTPGALAGAISLLHLRGLVRLHGASVLPTGSLLDGRA